MTDLDLANLSITRAARALRDKELSPLELTEAYLARIERLNPQVNAYITVTANRALEDARRATQELAAGKVRGPLHGIPVAHKDLYETAGIRTTGGSSIHGDFTPQADCTVAAKLRAAGTILLGKLNTHEYAYGVSTNNPHFGPTRNPWDLERIPGGSSGGSGAAIAAGLATATTGSDTGGSVRMPASVCGVVGLKPTYGRVSKAGVLPLSYLFDHTGPLTRTVQDAALMFNAMAGYDPADAASLRLPVEDVTAARIGQDTVAYGNIEESLMFAMIRCTAPFNATHLPALSLPCGFTRAGLPVGMQIAGRPCDEALVLRVGHAYEQATSWHTRSPAL